MNDFTKKLDSTADKLYFMLIELKSQNNPKNNARIKQLEQTIQLMEKDIEHLKD